MLDASGLTFPDVIEVSEAHAVTEWQGLHWSLYGCEAIALGRGVLDPGDLQPTECAALLPVVCGLFVLQLAGWVCDKGVGRVSSTMWVTVVAGERRCKQ
jgi:hypothetical protein